VVRRLLVVLVVVAMGVVIARGQAPCEVLALQPACDVALLPGPQANTLEIVTIDGGQTWSSAGELRLTTVAVDSQLGFMDWVRARLSPMIDTVARSVLFPEGTTTEDVAEQNRLLMARSQLDATIAGLVAAGFDADALYAGARIVEIVDGAADGAEALAQDDVIVAVDGDPMRTADDVVQAMGERRPGDTVTLTLADGRQADLVAATHPEHDDRAFLGLLLVAALDLPFEIDIDAGNIGGPSAGLMFALGIADLLGPDDLTGGMTIAGTGTITVDGEVGAVGGIRQKVSAATRPTDDDLEPATVFLVPVGNLADARTATVFGEILLVPVETIDDALTALADLRRGVDPPNAVTLAP
jgi:Lon-like protease